MKNSKSAAQKSSFIIDGTFFRAGISKKSSDVCAQCEVIAVAPGAAPKEDSKKTSFVMSKDHKEFNMIVGKLAETGELTTKAGTARMVRFAAVGQGMHMMVVGTGTDGAGVNQLGAVERIRRLGGTVANALAAEKINSVVVHLDSFLLPQNKLSIAPDALAYAFAEGMGLAAYRFKKYFTAGKKDKTAGSEDDKLTVHFAAKQASRLKAFERGLERAEALLAGAEICRNLGNEPSNVLYPETLAAEAKKLASENKLKFTVLDEKDLAKEKMGLLLGVGQGSARPPRLIMLEYVPPKMSKKTRSIALVGKGITFDSGGISIKPSTGMENMKHDMCGAAAVIGTIVTAAKLKLNTHIYTVVAAAENMPSGDAICPGNILNSRSGKTVEIVNTDAEGRLVLADALDFIQDKKPDYVIDLATLTGAAGITLGKTCAALLGNDAAFTRRVQDAAKNTGERVWELPMFDEYFDDLRSDYADMRNSGDTPFHGTAKGAMFLKQFIRKETRWAHLDIAYVAHGVSGVSYYPRKASTGYGVRLLIELMSKLA